MAEQKRMWQEVDDNARRLGKTLLRTARYGALAVIDAEDGAPEASRVNVATTMAGELGFLASQLSPHFGSLEHNPRCSILVGEPGKGDPLAHPRITIVGRAERFEDGPARQTFRRRFLWRHPKSALYVDFGDMALWRLIPERVLLNGGYGKAYMPEAADLAVPQEALPGLEAMEESAVDHMNQDHQDAIDRYAKSLGKTTTGWRLTGLDPEGLDLMRDDDSARLWYDTPLTSAEDLRSRLVEIARS